MDEEKVKIYAYEYKHNFQRIDDLLRQIANYSKEHGLEMINTAANNARAYIPEQYPSADSR